MISEKRKQIRATFDDKTIRVYQAYSTDIAQSALNHGTFLCPPFKINRMTWIKPSFLWMMYRAGWGFKDINQRCILAIDITKEGFDWALNHSCPSHPEPGMSQEAWNRLKENSPVRIQWDPERDIFLQALPHRSIQIGLSGIAVTLYIDQWIQQITNVTPLAHQIQALMQAGQTDTAKAMLPVETVYRDAS